MFEDFDKAKASKEERGRMGVSFLISAGIFVGILAALAAAIATARVVVKRKQRDMEVAFAELPRVPKPRPVVKAAPGKRKAALRAALRAPTAIPDEKPPEAEGELAEAGKLGPVDGFTDGSGDGRGGGRSEQETETVAEPRFLDGCRAPEIPEALHSTAATIEIDVRMMIDERGRVTAATMLRSHPLVPDDVILRCARAQIFRPAHLPDGTTVPYPYRRRFVFKPQGV
jgi:periplasmic protein TonB